MHNLDSRMKKLEEYIMDVSNGITPERERLDLMFRIAQEVMDEVDSRREKYEIRK